MAKSGTIILHPKSKQSKPSSGNQTSHTRTHQAARSGHDTNRREVAQYAEIPPGPPNFIVRTPYPLAPSKEDKTSE